MKNIDPELKQHLSSEVLTIAYCLQIILQNKKIIGLTNFDQNLIIDNITYETTPGLNIDILKYDAISGNSTKIETTINSNIIKEEEILSGLYDFATVKIFFVNYTNLTQGSAILFHGNIDKIILNNDKFTAEVKSTFNILSRNIGDLFSSSCRAQFCDNKCKLNKEAFTNIHSITRVVSNQEFECINLINIDNYYTYGSIVFITGKNSNLTLEIQVHNKSYIKLYTPTPYKISINDRFSIVAGCDKSFTTCSNRFNNGKNFRGEPHIPEIHF
ncbi:phage conserved hypothetical BR0599 family protein [Ehrlichia chaffeensis str. Heartland]|uniref:Bacteriophage phiJL001 Gp84 C-terminal domain-containing protein n=1 Tax=Ehrlichia chaffeensis (strain ATCC CRL-10679 / Arkansas) TaxID=205920 RepID=Q2GG02_EHRCR|nr:DUF2163 domain-containing protein [Ehrlichia chaffeensis]ABD45134.1 conserved hypothetical protein [Ehrlichia chaffeensis str. Arkansas]AHX03885.1 phage conserved hypothetical BR0599 family protein [Ehrlichia chaffeensis str. Heartland]AHX05389.1 phage conserved hypothetical BR0599 family protein [Ehrlichia chaffeensis str. Jax]AHX06375.1 phage conserved hypothetical BR0599 family protein [Ehrlichia chaffeensis str. Liberty]AHX08001.1 phage conserved hypothetical BR0599 family protein [Ehrl